MQACLSRHVHMSMPSQHPPCIIYSRQSVTSDGPYVIVSTLVGTGHQHTM